MNMKLLVLGLILFACDFASAQPATTRASAPRTPVPPTRCAL
jgi:hypothetical protein